MSEEAPEPQAPQPGPQPIPQPATPLPNAPGVPTLVQPILGPQPVADDKDAALEAIQQIERTRGSRVFVYWTSPLAKMADGSVPPLYD